MDISLISPEVSVHFNLPEICRCSSPVVSSLLVQDRNFFISSGKNLMQLTSLISPLGSRCCGKTV